MGQNLFGGQTARSFARGEAPPSDSYEWVGVAKPPEPKKPSVRKQETPVIVATMRETIVLEKKPKKLKYLGIGAAAGAGLTYFWLKIRSF